MDISGKEIKILNEALISAFPDYEKLKRMVRFQLDENLEKIVGKGTIDEVIFNLSNWAEEQDKLKSLIEGAYEENPGNQRLKSFYETIFLKHFPVNQYPSNNIISEEQKNELIDILAEVFSGSSDYEILKITLEFTGRLAQTKYIPESGKSRIQQWLEKIANEKNITLPTYPNKPQSNLTKIYSNNSFEESIVSITSYSDRKANVVGTGFAFYQEPKFTYLLTCAHVVQYMGGKENVLVNNIPAEIVAIGDIRGFDLAVLRVAELDHIPLLKLTILSPQTEKDLNIKICGNYFYSGGNKIFRETVEGIIETSQKIKVIQFTEQATIWKLQLQKGRLKKGYSGAPVVESQTGLVLGVTTNMEGKNGEEGTAISIEALRKIWPEIPLDNI